MMSTLFFLIFIVCKSLHKDLKPYQFSFVKVETKPQVAQISNFFSKQSTSKQKLFACDVFPMHLGYSIVQK